MNHPSASRLAGIAFVAASAASFGALGVFGKIAFASGASTSTVLFLRFLIAGTVMAAVMIVRRIPWPRGGDLRLLAAMGALGYVGQAYCYFSSLKYASAGLTALLLYLYPAMVTLAAAALGRQRLTAIKAIAVVVAFAGILLTVAGRVSGTAEGVAYGAGAAAIYTVYILVGERASARTGSIAAATVIMLAAAGVYGIGVAWNGAGWPHGTTGWWAVAGIALISTVVAMAGFFAGMKRLGASDAATISTLEPVVTLLLAAAVLGETLTPVQVGGAALVLCSVVALARAGRP